jgi:hypothetical protein
LQPLAQLLAESLGTRMVLEPDNEVVGPSHDDHVTARRDDAKATADSRCVQRAPSLTPLGPPWPAQSTASEGGRRSQGPDP